MQDRIIIQVLRSQGQSLRQIARALNCSPNHGQVRAWTRPDSARLHSITVNGTATMRKQRKDATR